MMTEKAQATPKQTILDGLPEWKQELVVRIAHSYGIGVQTAMESLEALRMEPVGARMLRVQEELEEELMRVRSSSRFMGSP